MKEVKEGKWILPFMISLNGTENSPVRLNIRAAEENILVQVHAHKVTIQVILENKVKYGLAIKVYKLVYCL